MDFSHKKIWKKKDWIPLLKYFNIQISIYIQILSIINENCHNRKGGQRKLSHLTQSTVILEIIYSNINIYIKINY